MVFLSKEEILASTCKLLIGNNGTYISTPWHSPSPRLISLAVSCFSLALLLMFFVNRAVNLIFNKESRTVALVGCYGSIIATVSVCMFIIFYMYGYEMLPGACPVITLPSLVFLEIYTQSHLRFHNFTCCRFYLTYIASTLIPIGFLQISPQAAYHQCDHSTLALMTLLIALFACYFTIFLDRSMSFWKTLKAEKLYIWKKYRCVGYLIRKEGVWIKCEFAADQGEKQLLPPA